MKLLETIVAVLKGTDPIPAEVEPIAAKTAPAKARPVAAKPKAARSAAPSGASPICIDGDDEGRVFVYDGTYVNRIKRGQCFYADILPRDMTLTSTATGTECNSSEFGNAVLSYMGKPFGMVPYELGCLKDMSRRKLVSKVKLKRVGTYCKGIPELVTLTADRHAIEHWWNRSKRAKVVDVFDEAHEVELIKREKYAKRTGLKIPFDAEIVWIHPTEKTWVDGKLPRKTIRFAGTIAMKPTPEGSQAKPHVVILAGTHPVIELSAAYGKTYKALAARAGSSFTAAYIYDYYKSGGSDSRVLLAIDPTRDQAEPSQAQGRCS